MREVIVSFRLTKPEREEFKKRASESNQSVSELIRAKIIKD